MNNRGVIVAFLIGGAVLLGVSMFANRVRNAKPEAAPGITIAQPTDALSNPAPIRFITTAGLRASAGGWSADDLHAHATVDGSMFMPMNSDIEHVSADTFALHLPRMSSGAHEVRIFWADGAHRAVGDSAIARIQVTR